MTHRCGFLFRALDSSLWILGFFPGLVLALFLIGVFRVSHKFRSLCRWKCWLIDIAWNPPSPVAMKRISCCSQTKHNFVATIKETSKAANWCSTSLDVGALCSVQGLRLPPFLPSRFWERRDSFCHKKIVASEFVVEGVCVFLFLNKRAVYSRRLSRDLLHPPAD
jgi:hypothetical protein